MKRIPPVTVYARQLNEQGIGCLVVALSLVPLQKNRRAKTDRREAVRLAHFLRSSDLVEVTVLIMSSRPDSLDRKAFGVRFSFCSPLGRDRRVEKPRPDASHTPAAPP